MKFVFFTAMIISLQTLVLAQDLSFEELENAPSNEIDGLEFIDQLTNQKEAVEKARVRVLKPQPLPPPEVRPDAFRAVIPKGTIITRLSDDQDFKTSRRIQIWAQEIYPGSQVTHILDKDNLASFSARSIHVVPIEADLKLTPAVNPKITYDRSAGLKYSAFENSLKIKTDLTWELESIAPNFWNQVFNQSLESASGTRLTLKTFYDDFRLPVKFGLGVSYQNAAASDVGFEIKWTALFIGPQLSYTFINREAWQFDLEAQAGAAIFSSARTASERYSPSSYEWGLAGKYIRKTWLGDFLASLEYRTNYISLNEGSSETDLSDQKQAQTSLALSLGYRIGFEL
tara:strand:- start:13560 stop:14588 length:1029 start_codon:yes stop_codon:yes gene_type:complete